jgi:hypothetical protein
VTILTLIFGGETILAMLDPTYPTPAFITSPWPWILFAGTHLMVSRSSLTQLIPKRNSFLTEWVMCLTDGLVSSSF